MTDIRNSPDGTERSGVLEQVRTLAQAHRDERDADAPVIVAIDELAYYASRPKASPLLDLIRAARAT